MTNTPTPTEILLTKLDTNDAKASTIGQFLAKLTKTVWIEEEGFSGKRPFGNSGWKGPIIHALILEGHLQGELDEDGYIEDYSTTEFNALMAPVFELLHNADYTTLALPPEPLNHYLYKLEHANGRLHIVDYYVTPVTEKEAEKKMETLKQSGHDKDWFIYRIEE